ncbi:MAG: molybdopterin molybdotransferase MoeA [Candidatus Jordarchaeales archaeon]
MSDVRMKGFYERKSLKEVLESVLPVLPRTRPEKIPTTSALGRIAYGDIRAKRDVPHFDRAAMDGYAVVAEDTFKCSQENPARLRLVGECVVGRRTDIEVRRGEAAQISTGAPMPRGANAVVMLEYASLDEGYVKVYKPVAPFQNVSRRGEDVKAGDVVVADGSAIRPQEIGLLLQCGVLEVSVASRPRVAIASTGSELVDADKEPDVGQVVASNEHMLAAMTKIYGGEPVYLGIVPDEREAIKAVVTKALSYDITVISGGTSVGKYDYVPEVVAEIGGKIVAHGLTIRPGGPTAVFLVGDKPVVCLPGFPVAAMVAFESVVVPLIRKMLGARVLDPRPVVDAVLARRVPSTIGRRDFLRVKLEEGEGGIVAVPLRTAGSGVLSSMTRADGVVEIPEDVEGLEEGEKVRVKLFPHVF